MRFQWFKSPIRTLRRGLGDLRAAAKGEPARVAATYTSAAGASSLTHSLGVSADSGAGPATKSSTASRRARRGIQSNARRGCDAVRRLPSVISSALVERSVSHSDSDTLHARLRTGPGLASQSKVRAVTVGVAIACAAGANGNDQGPKRATLTIGSCECTGWRTRRRGVCYGPFDSAGQTIPAFYALSCSPLTLVVRVVLPAIRPVK